MTTGAEGATSAPAQDNRRQTKTEEKKKKNMNPPVIHLSLYNNKKTRKEKRK